VRCRGEKSTSPAASRHAKRRYWYFAKKNVTGVNEGRLHLTRVNELFFQPSGWFRSDAFDESIDLRLKPRNSREWRGGKRSESDSFGRRKLFIARQEPPKPRRVLVTLLAFLVWGCADQIQQYEQNQPVQTPLGPDVSFCLHMTMEGCAPLQPADPGFGGCEDLHPLAQQEQGCWQGRSAE
jgi:hypothetical protein